MFTKFLFFSFLINVSTGEDDIWEQDLTSEMKIGLSMTGYQSVDLKCGADSFFVNATVDNDFDGVIYTRGDFKAKDPDCFIRSVKGKKLDTGLLFKMKIPFNKCHTLEDASDQQFVNTLIIQHDSDLIMPGDAAFRLSCAFEPEQKLGSTLLTAAPKSRIVLVDADPAADKKLSKFEAQSDTDRVSFPNNRKKDEL